MRTLSVSLTMLVGCSGIEDVPIVLPTKPLSQLPAPRLDVVASASTVTVGFMIDAFCFNPDAPSSTGGSCSTFTIAGDRITFALPRATSPGRLDIFLQGDGDWLPCTGARCQLYKTPQFTHSIAWRSPGQVRKMFIKDAERLRANPKRASPPRRYGSSSASSAPGEPIG